MHVLSGEGVLGIEETAPGRLSAPLLEAGNHHSLSFGGHFQGAEAQTGEAVPAHNYLLPFLHF